MLAVVFLRKVHFADGSSSHCPTSNLLSLQHQPSYAASLRLPWSSTPFCWRRTVEINSISFHPGIYSFTRGLPMADLQSSPTASTLQGDFFRHSQHHPEPYGTLPSRNSQLDPNSLSLHPPAVERWRKAFEFIRLTLLRPSPLGGLLSPHYGISRRQSVDQPQPPPPPPERLSSSAKRRARRFRSMRIRPSCPPEAQSMGPPHASPPDPSRPLHVGAPAAVALSGSLPQADPPVAPLFPSDQCSLRSVVTQPLSPPPPPPTLDAAVVPASPTPDAALATVPPPAAQQSSLPPSASSLGSTPQWRPRGNRSPPRPLPPFNQPGRCPHRLTAHRRGCHCPRDGTSWHPPVTQPPPPIDAADLSFIGEAVAARGGGYEPSMVPLWRLPEWNCSTIPPGTTCVQLLAERLAHKEAFLRSDLYDHELEAHFVDILEQLLPAVLVGTGRVVWLPAAAVLMGEQQSTHESLRPSRGGESARVTVTPAEEEGADASLAAAPVDTDAAWGMGRSEEDDEMVADFDLPSDDSGIFAAGSL